jgi:hypothetical protein
MDLRLYYKKIRDIEELLEGDHFIVVSLATSEGGKDGVRTQVSKANAAKLIAEGRARLASDDEQNEYLDAQREDRERFEVEQAARQMQLVVVPPADTRKTRERN